MNKQKIITHFIGDFNFGGIQRLVFDLVTEQKNNKSVLPKILVLKNDGLFKEKFRSLDINIISINPKSTYDFDFFQIKKVFNTFKNSDVIHLHGFHIYAAVLTFFLKSKVVYTVHGNFSFGRKKRVGDYINHFLSRLYFKLRVNLLVANSDFTKNYLIQNWNLNLDCIKVVLNGINIKLKAQENILNKIRSKYDNKFIVGTTSRLVGFKKINRLIKAFKLFSYDKKDVALLIVGDGTEKENLEKYVKNNKVRDVYFTGFKDNVFDYQSAFDVCVFPSKNEPFGLVAVESYCAEKPVLVFNDGGGLIEIVSKYNNDDIVSSEDELVQRIQFYYKNYGKYSKEDFNDVINYFSAKRMEADYYKIYNRI